MRVAVPREIVAGEKRVALVPEVIPPLVRLGHEVGVQSGAGIAAGFPDEAYAAAGASIVPEPSNLYAAADLILKVQRPTADEMGMLESGKILIGLLQPAADPRFFADLAARGVIACSMELVPRTTRAQAIS